MNLNFCKLWAVIDLILITTESSFLSSFSKSVLQRIRLVPLPVYYCLICNHYKLLWQKLRHIVGKIKFDEAQLVIITWHFNQE